MSGTLAVRDGRMRFWIDSVDAAEAKKVEDASFTALQIHKPPAFTGILACDTIVRHLSICLRYYYYYYFIIIIIIIIIITLIIIIIIIIIHILQRQYHLIKTLNL